MNRRTFLAALGIGPAVAKARRRMAIDEFLGGELVPGHELAYRELSRALEILNPANLERTLGLMSEGGK